MQKSLKKSLYLGLAALSFASVAGATNANAAKKHSAKKAVKAVKPVTYTSSYNLDQSVVYSLNGNNAIYTKPGTVKGARVVASKSDVKSVANSSKGYFMAYGEAKTSKGVHYYKVVSFDKKYRGWVYAGSAKKVDATTNSTSNPSNTTVYLKGAASNGLWNAPKYSAFKTSKSVANNNALRNDAFTVDKTVKLAREGWTYYHVTDQKDSSINGWIFAGAVDVKPDNTYFNSTTDVKLNFTSNGSSIYNKVVKISDLTKIPGYSDTYNKDSHLSTNNSDTLISRLNNAVKSSVSDFNRSGQYKDVTNYFNDNPNLLSYVKAGDTINIPIGSLVTSKVNFALVNGTSLSSSNLNLPKVTQTAANKAMSFDGNSARQLISMPNNMDGSNLNKGYTSNFFSGVNNSLFGYQNDSGLLNNSLTVVLGKDSGYTSGNNTDPYYKAEDVFTSGVSGTGNNAVVNAQDVKGVNYNVFGTKSDSKSNVYQGSYYTVYVLDRDATVSKNAGKHYGDDLTLYYNAYKVEGTVKNTGDLGTYYAK